MAQWKKFGWLLGAGFLASASMAAARADEPARSGGEPVRVVEWEQLAFRLEDRSKFRMEDLPDSIRQLDGCRVRIRGFFHGGSVFSSRGIKHFVLLGEIKTKPVSEKSPWRDVPLHYWMTVEMAEGQSAVFTTKPITVSGRFSIKCISIEGTPVAIFQIVADSVEAAEPRPGYHCALVGGC